MTLDFTHVTQGQRVRFGAGKAEAHLAEEVSRLGATTVMVVSRGRGLADARRIATGIEVAVWHPEAAMHVPVRTAERAREVAVRNEVDLLVSVGGGSATGLAKAVALTTGIPVIAVPTTYSGSEATDVWGLTEDGRKTTGHAGQVLPVTVIYDSDLARSLPVDVSVASGLNALAHCVDSLWAPGADPVNAALAGEGARVLAEGLPRIVDDPGDVDGRDAAFYGGYLAAVAFTSAGSGLHHKICHVLGGSFGLPHAQTHATVLPYVLAFNVRNAPAAEQRLAHALGSVSAVAGMRDLYRRVSGPQRLGDLGFRHTDIDHAVELILEAVPAGNPRPVRPSGLTALLRAACDGTDPSLLIDLPG